jgi:hypothetical protein
MDLSLKYVNELRLQKDNKNFGKFLLSRLCIRHDSGLHPSGFRTKVLYALLSPLYVLHNRLQFIPDVITLNNIS